MEELIFKKVNSPKENKYNVITTIILHLRPFSTFSSTSLHAEPPLLRGGVARIRGRQSKIRVKAEHGSPVNGPVTSTGRWKNCAISPLHGWAKFLGFLPESEPREKPAQGINGANYDPIPPPNRRNFPREGV